MSCLHLCCDGLLFSKVILVLNIALNIESFEMVSAGLACTHENLVRYWIWKCCMWISWCMKNFLLWEFLLKLWTLRALGMKIHFMVFFSIMKQKSIYPGNLSCHFPQGILNDKQKCLAAETFKSDSDFALKNLSFSVSFFNWSKKEIET